MKSITLTVSLGHIWKALAIIGGIALLISVFFDTAPEGTHNLGLLQTQLLLSQFAALCLLAAAVLFVGVYLGEKLDLLALEQDKTSIGQS